MRAITWHLNWITRSNAEHATTLLRRRLYEIFEHGTIGGQTGVTAGRLVVIPILANLVSVTLDGAGHQSTGVGRSGSLHALMEREPRVAKRIRETVRSRIGRDIVSPRGDVITEELEEAETLAPAHDDGARP